jgi:hypothetical protein
LRKCDNCGRDIPIEQTISYPVFGFIRFFCSWRCVAEFTEHMIREIATTLKGG